MRIDHYEKGVLAEAFLCLGSVDEKIRLFLFVDVVVKLHGKRRLLVNDRVCVLSEASYATRETDRRTYRVEIAVAVTHYVNVVRLLDRLDERVRDDTGLDLCMAFNAL